MSSSPLSFPPASFSLGTSPETLPFLSQEEGEKLLGVLNAIFRESLSVYKGLSTTPPSFSSSQWDELFQTGSLFQKFLEALSSNPQYWADSQVAYWVSFMELWQKTSLAFWGQDGASPPISSRVSGPVKDKRFLDKAWEEHPFFSFVKNFYLLTAQNLLKGIHTTEGLDERTRKKLEFFTQNLINAFSPSNFLLTNPEVLRHTIENKGENLLKGFKNFLKDLEKSQGVFQIATNDTDAFEVGKNLAITPGKVVYENDLMQLIQYSPQTQQVYERPLLIIPPWINKYYILDLKPENSFINWIVQQGYTVFLISWVNPDKRHAHKDFEDYMQEGPLEALSHIQKVTGESQVHALGYCIGGTLLACTLAYLAQIGQSSPRFASGTYLATLLDFSDAGELGIFLDEEQINIFEKKMSHEGYLDGGSVALSFKLLRSNDLIWNYFVKNYLLGGDPFPFDMLYWNGDNTNMPLKMHSFYLRGMYLHNLLMHPGGLRMSGVPIDLSQVTTPLYFLGTEQDHIVPWKATYKGLSLYPQAPCTFVLGGAGHVAGVINPPPAQKYGYATNPSQKGQNAEQWRQGATSHSGSWWVHWEQWMRPQSGSQIPARKPGDHGYPILEDAPGRYVKRQLSETQG